MWSPARPHLDEIAVDPYRAPAAPKEHPRPVVKAREQDALDYFFWVLVAVLGLAVANGGGSASAPAVPHDLAR